MDSLTGALGTGARSRSMTRTRMGIDQSELETTVGAVVEPELGLPLAETGMLVEVSVRRRRARVRLALPVEAWPSAEDLATAVERVASTVAGVEDVELEMGVMNESQRSALRSTLRRAMLGTAADDAPDDGHGHEHGGHGGGHGHGHGQSGFVAPAFLQPESNTRVIGVSSGKGGVGKSTVTVNLAVALAAAGHKVGLLDADVYGFSVPKMLGTDHDPVVLGDIVVPTEAHGVRCLSMGYFVPDDQPVIWRGPMLHKAIQQFLADAFWGSPDFLLVDMPPGTGDVALTMAEVMPKAEVIVVTTPQEAAQRVAQRSAFAARRLKLSVRGVVENMSWFTGRDGARYEIFGDGGGQLLAHDLGVPLLGQVPLVEAVRHGGDEGRPIVTSEPDSETAGSFRAIAERLATMGPARVYRRELGLRS
ncbi:MAG TPA: Mrp/NBP35 family ATP-binding protein [Acidimicrobiales bacterium]|nr:Mrp/NBP35 family ATP-binding protein [Acidimicrobiales bacterium]